MTTLHVSMSFNLQTKYFLDFFNFYVVLINHGISSISAVSTFQYNPKLPWKQTFQIRSYATSVALSVADPGGRGGHPPPALLK